MQPDTNADIKPFPQKKIYEEKFQIFQNLEEKNINQEKKNPHHSF